MNLSCQSARLMRMWNFLNVSFEYVMRETAAKFKMQKRLSFETDMKSIAAVMSSMKIYVKSKWGLWGLRVLDSRIIFIAGNGNKFSHSRKFPLRAYFTTKLQVESIFKFDHFMDDKCFTCYMDYLWATWKLIDVTFICLLGNCRKIEVF